jgi:hypothetical protein
VSAGSDADGQLRICTSRAKNKARNSCDLHTKIVPIESTATE